VSDLTIDPSLSGSLILIILVFVLVIGSFFSLGVLRFFQQRAKSGAIFMAAFVISLVIFIIVINRLV